MTVNEAFAILVADLAAEGVPAPLAQRFTLRAVWADLAAIAAEPPPADDAHDDLRDYTDEYRHRAEAIVRGLRIDADQGDEARRSLR